jgi:uncharacterized RDD family membrane protein YckC
MATSDPPVRFPQIKLEEVPAISTDGTVQARHIAAAFDLPFAMLLAVVAGKMLDEEALALQAPVVAAAFLGYYFVFECLLCRTPGKLLTGLVVTQYDGTRCTWRQTLVRTLLRVLEVNPLLFGGLPAAACIVFTRDHQRIGDAVARTIVVPANRRPKRQRPAGD